MRIQRMLIDKFLGLTALVIATQACLMVAKSFTFIQGPLLWRRLLGLAGISIAFPVAFVASYIGTFLLRYPPERRSSAEEIAKIAARQGEALTPLWRDK